MPDAYEAYRHHQIKDGLLFQDFVVDLLFQTVGLVVVQYASRQYQQAVGESRTGVEIKHDKKFATTRRLWIELAEKARPREGDYCPSGIYRDDNTWLYVIGDYDVVFGFPKAFLRSLAARYQVLENHTKTSRGYLLPEADAFKYAALVLHPKAASRVAKMVRDLDVAGRELHAIVRSNPAQASLFERWVTEEQAS